MTERVSTLREIPGAVEYFWPDPGAGDRPQNVTLSEMADAVSDLAYERLMKRLVDEGLLPPE